MSRIAKLLISVAVCLGAGAVGSIFTVQTIPTWYAGLIKPSFSPPNWLFAPVWTLLYILMGTSLYLVWRKGVKTKKIRDAIVVFAIQLFLNLVWSPVFFGARNVFLGFVVIVVLWFYIVKTIRVFAKIDRLASRLLYPYIAWVSFATILNFSIWILNM